MQYHWRKEKKYYKLSLQANLFGSIDIICSWGSLSNNHTGYKVILCKNQLDIDTAVQAIAKRRRSRGYLPFII